MKRKTRPFSGICSDGQGAKIKYKTVWTSTICLVVYLRWTMTVRAALEMRISPPPLFWATQVYVVVWGLYVGIWYTCSDSSDFILTALLPWYHCTSGKGNPLARHSIGTKSPIPTLCGDDGEIETLGTSAIVVKTWVAKIL